MPDLMQAPTPEATRFFLAEVPICPRCTTPLRRATGGTGSFYLTCDTRMMGKRCGQHVHLLAVEGVVAVTAISKDQYEEFRRTYARARKVYSDVGVVASRPGPEFVPEYPCSGCGEATKLFDLYAGECRSCRDQRSASE